MHAIKPNAAGEAEAGHPGEEQAPLALLAPASTLVATWNAGRFFR
jgi:hypothetical protein